jgi:pyruvate,orthophosphate dikinase
MGSTSGSGVCFSRNPSSGRKELYGEYLSNSQGEDIVAGSNVPMPIGQLGISFPKIYDELVNTASTLEKHFRDMQDIEFTIEEGKLYILQTRSGKRTFPSAVKIAVDMVKDGIITIEEAISRIDINELRKNMQNEIDPSVSSKPIAKGIGASPNVATGKAIFTSNDAIKYLNCGEKVILVRPETSPEDIRGVTASEGVLTIKGGMTSHAAVVMRGMGKPAVVGAESITIDMRQERFMVGNTIVNKLDPITVDGNTGNIYLGSIRTIEKEQSKEYKELYKWVRERTKSKEATANEKSSNFKQ